MRIIVDCNNVGFAAAYTNGGLSYKTVPTGVLFGFVNQIIKFAKLFSTNKFIFCWDSKKSYRKVIFPEYKQNRKKDLTDEEHSNLIEVYKQFKVLRKDLLPLMGFKNVFIQTGYEADDLIAYIVQRIPGKYVIISTDNDLWQLINRGRKDAWVKFYNYRNKTLIDYEKFVNTWKIEPYKWATVKAIAGCSTDGVPGIKGVGEVKAIKYIKGSMVKGKIYDRIKNGVDIISRNSQLVALPFAGPKPIDINGLVFDDMYTLDFIDVFSKYGFGSLLKTKRFDEITGIFELVRGRK